MKMNEYYSDPSNPGFKELNERSEEKEENKPIKLKHPSKFENKISNKQSKRR